MFTLQQYRRVPQTCPPAFLGRYTVQPGDTFFNIAQIFRTRFEALVVNNPHITNPNIIYPGDVLCVPGLIPYPCSIILMPIVSVPFGTGGVAYINFAPRGGQAVSFLATLAQPSVFGNFDIYIGEIYIPNIGGFGNQLFPTPEDPPTWSTRIELPTVASILPDSRLVIRPSNSLTGISGNTILEAIIHNEICHL
ncbi:LysM peptidoglycan-binding domain-containing protein [Petroclostridium sp. X23]|uniref:LysM peptidoglycan-binding domain-containing protein n=1 Tax=Petroclostridium sp. X23 TaxID=3045146 RepID=UPI0024AE5F28|nr:LysM peptidoglycan-binding domain-containing protein [Petroclostridium sp. X23]WHH60672.1 LysM peptidoglycan-binding domain-containing protein [Petroclostridium sp. X23]